MRSMYVFMCEYCSRVCVRWTEVNIRRNALEIALSCFALYYSILPSIGRRRRRQHACIKWNNMRHGHDARDACVRSCGRHYNASLGPAAARAQAHQFIVV